MGEMGETEGIRKRDLLYQGSLLAKTPLFQGGEEPAAPIPDRPRCPEGIFCPMQRKLQSSSQGGFLTRICLIAGSIDEDRQRAFRIVYDAARSRFPGRIACNQSETQEKITGP